MKLNTILITVLFSAITFSSFSQVAIDPTGKRFMKPRERTKFGGPTQTTHKIPSGPDNINITFIEIQIDPSSKGGIEVTARGTKTPKVRGCDNCTVAGRVILSQDAAKEIESVSNDEPTKVKQAKNAAACRKVVFKNADNQEYAVVSSAEGSFMLSTLPNGTFSIYVGGKKVITDFILTTVEPTEEQLKKEKEMLDARKKEKEMTQEQPATDH